MSTRHPTRRSLTLGLGALVACPWPASAQELVGAPGQHGDGWPVTMAEAAALDPDRMRAMVEWLDGLRSCNVHSVLVARAGQLAFEHYRRGSDWSWQTPLPDAMHGPDVLHDMRSISKSITSLLVGIALDRKLIASIDEAVFTYFPEYSDLRTAEKDRITLRHLLTMSAGLEWDENLPYNNPNNSEIAMIRSGNRWRFALQPRLVAEPGSEWNYSGGCTELLGAVVSRVAGRPLDEFAQEALFAPLGIANAEWARYPDKLPAAASGLRLRSRDLAKIGQLVLARGQWDAKQVVSAQWIEASTKPQIGPADRISFYGYQWWLGRSLVKGREITWIAGFGLGGQRLFIVPTLDLICVITAGHYNQPMQNWLPNVIFNRYVLAGIG
jgi:CubicO group peptidase (beta-lactamase class C family)